MVKNDIGKTLIILSGYNQRAVVAFLRTLETNKLQYAIIANSKDDTIFLTKYKHRVLAVRKNNELILPDILNNIKIVQGKIRSNKYIIAPSTEALNRFLLKNKNKFEKYLCEIPLVDENLYETISDKYKFYKICIQSKVVVPKEYIDVKKAKLPFVVKPKNYFGENGVVYNPLLIFNKEDQKCFVKNIKISDFYCQEYIAGRSFYLLYYFFKDGTVCKLSQENLLQQPGGKSIIAAESSDYHLTEESLKYEHLFKSLNFFGLVMVEVKQQKNVNYMIEANPRFWGPSQLFVDAGVNLFEAFLYDIGMISSKPTFKKNMNKTKYFWFGGVSQFFNDDRESIVYHNYSSNDYVKDFLSWLKSDIYFREDTIELFKKELKYNAKNDECYKRVNR